MNRVTVEAGSPPCDHEPTADRSHRTMTILRTSREGAGYR
jgi:hypothetical protein